MMHHHAYLRNVSICVLLLVTGILLHKLTVNTVRHICISNVLHSTNPRTVFYQPQAFGSSLFLTTSDRSSTCHIADESGGISSLALSPDGNAVLFTAETLINNAPPMPIDLYVMNIDGSNKRRLTNGGRLESFANPAWSPDSKKIVFTRQMTADERIYLANVDDSTIQWLGPTGLRATHPRWSTDGQHIIFEVLYYQSPYSMWYSMNIDGSSPHPLELYKSMVR